MLKSPTNVKQWFQDNVIPTVLVITSEDADALCRKNDLDLADILRAHGTAEGPFNIDYTIQHDRRSVQLRNLRVRFLSLQEWPAPSEVECSAVLQQLVNASAKNFKVDDSIKISSKHTSPNYVIERRDPTPWYTSFLDELFVNLRSSEHETFFHPVACIVAISSKCDNPTRKLTDLFNVQRAPSLFQKGHIDPNIHKTYVLLHDPSDVQEEQMEKCFREMKTSFGANMCRLLRMNTNGETGTDQSDFWAPYMLKRPMSTRAPESVENAETLLRSPSIASPFERTSSSIHLLPLSTKRGAYLSGNDLNGVEAFVKDLVSKGIIPHMEKKIKEINELVTSNRQGFFNQVSAMLRRKPTNSTASDVYPFNTLEACVRQMADYLFYLQDYLNAQNFYKMCSKDFSRDSALKHFAGAQEMQAISQFMADTSRIPVETMKQALSSYEKLPDCKMYFLRGTLFYYEILKSNSLYRESIELILRQKLHESDLNAALLLEQAAYCFYYLQSQHLRKYAFHMVLAGNKFGLSNQKWHSWRCYLLALAIYSNKNWTFIEDHLYSTLGRLCQSLGHLEDSINYFAKVLTSSKQRAGRQAIHMREFLAAVEAFGGGGGVSIRNLAIPSIENESVQVILNDYSMHPQDPENSQEAWNTLEKSMNDKFDARLQFQVNKPRISVVGESIYFEVVVSNPLQVQLQLSNFRILCDNNPDAAKTAITPEPYSENVDTGLVISTLSEELQLKSPDFVDIESTELVMNPMEKKRVRIRICPTSVGVLSIKGVSYQISSPNGVVTSQRFFALRGRRLNRRKEEKVKPVYEPNKSLVLRVIEPMPLLRAEFHEFPKALLHGEECKIMLEITNFGQRAMNNVRLKLSHPGFISIGSPDQLESDFPANLKGPTFVSVDNDKAKRDHSIIRLPVSNLAPSQSVFLPVWIQGHQIGSHTFRFLFQYQSESENRDMNYRLLRAVHQLTVLPSIRVSAHVRPSHSKIDEYILATEVTNMSDVVSFHLCQISSVSSFWSIQPLSFDPASIRHAEEKDENTPLDLKLGETSTMYFRLVSRSKACIAGETPAPVPAGDESTILYSNLSFDGRTIDTSVCPFNDFLARHRSERDRSTTVSHRSRGNYEWNARTNSVSDVRKSMTHHQQNELFDLDLILLWEYIDASGSRRFGQHNMTNTALLSSMSETSANLPVRLKLHYPMSVTHDFTKSRLCIVPVTLVIRNCSPSDTIHVTFQATKSNDTTPGHSSASISESPYFWCGSTLSKTERLLPQETVRIPLQPCFSSAGIFNLNRFRISATVVGQTDSINITIPAQHLLHIQHKPTDAISEVALIEA